MGECGGTAEQLLSKREPHQGQVLSS